MARHRVNRCHRAVYRVFLRWYVCLDPRPVRRHGRAVGLRRILDIRAQERSERSGSRGRGARANDPLPKLRASRRENDPGLPEMLDENPPTRPAGKLACMEFQTERYETFLSGRAGSMTRFYIRSQSVLSHGSIAKSG